MVQVFINSSYSVRQTLFHLRHSSGLQGNFTNTNSSALSPANSTSSVLFPITRVLCHIADIYETQPCAITLNPALVFYLEKLPVDAAIHALIFRQVNRMLDLIQAQVTLSTHTKSNFRFLSRKTAC
jgi:hypothetical protein